MLDWYISLNDKDRMATCDVAYSPTNENKNSSTFKDADDSDTVLLLSPFLPRQRTFVLRSLESGEKYKNIF